MPVFSSSPRMAGAGPIPISDGSTPTTCQPMISAIGFNPSRAAASPSAITKHAAPSTIPLALPAVTVPSSPNAGFNFAIPSMVAFTKKWSSLSI